LARGCTKLLTANIALYWNSDWEKGCTQKFTAAGRQLRLSRLGILYGYPAPLLKITYSGHLLRVSGLCEVPKQFNSRKPRVRRGAHDNVKIIKALLSDYMILII